MFSDIARTSMVGSLAGASTLLFREHATKCALFLEKYAVKIISKEALSKSTATYVQATATLPVGLCLATGAVVYLTQNIFQAILTAVIIGEDRDSSAIKKKIVYLSSSALAGATVGAGLVYFGMATAPAAAALVGTTLAVRLAVRVLFSDSFLDKCRDGVVGAAIGALVVSSKVVFVSLAGLTYTAGATVGAVTALTTSVAISTIRYVGGNSLDNDISSGLAGLGCAGFGVYVGVKTAAFVGIGGIPAALIIIGGVAGSFVCDKRENRVERELKEHYPQRPHHKLRYQG